MAHHDEDVVGKAYDARLMRRLLGYLRPYRLQAALALVAIIANSMLQLAQPWLSPLRRGQVARVATGRAAMVRSPRVRPHTGC